MSKGAITNTATATGTSPAGTKVTATSSVTVKSTCPTTTTLSLAKTSVTYGSETPEVFSVTVSSTMGTPTGTVTIGSSAGTLCTITLSSGKGTCSLTATQLAVGSYTSVVAAYAANGLVPGLELGRHQLLGGEGHHHHHGHGVAVEREPHGRGGRRLHRDGEGGQG